VGGPDLAVTECELHIRCLKEGVKVEIILEELGFLGLERIIGVEKLIG
jgi:hypothetical protein